MAMKKALMVFAIFFLIAAFSVPADSYGRERYYGSRPGYSRTVAYHSKSYPYFFMGFEAGVDLVTGAEDIGMESGAALYGFTAKLVGPNFGVGLTNFNAEHKDDESKPGVSKSRMSGLTLDLLFPFGRDNPYFVQYLVGSVGKGREDYTARYGSTEVSATNNFRTFGVGVGGFTKGRGGLSVGWEIEYFFFPNSKNADGTLQIKFNFGIVL